MQNRCMRTSGMMLLLALGLPAHASHAQTLQLPTFSSFSVETSVLVPDRGSALMGGTRRSSSGSSQSGPLRGSQSRGSSAAAGGIDVSAFVHDFEAMDQAVLAKAAQKRGEQTRENPNFPAARSGERLSSVADIRRRQVQGTGQEADDSGGYLNRARAAVADGKPNVARVYFQMAERRAQGSAKADIQAEMSGLGAAKSASKTARQR